MEEEFQLVQQEFRKLLLFLLHLTLNNDKKQWKLHRTAEGDMQIPRVALVDPMALAWTKLFESKNDQALVTITGFDHASFQSLPFFFAMLQQLHHMGWSL